MDELLQEFEAELKALTPRPIDPMLVDRVAWELTRATVETPISRKSHATISSRFKAWGWLGLGGLSVAAALVLMIALVRSAKPDLSVEPAPTKIAAEKKDSAEIRTAGSRSFGDLYQPVTASNVLYEMKDEGPASNQRENRERRVRYRYVDTYTWKNPRNNALLTWSVPRDEIRVQPAQFN